jgi:hypothetical protein
MRILVAVLLFAGPGRAAQPALEVVRTSPAGSPLLRNGGFEEDRDGGLAAWQAAPQGFRVAAGEGRSGSRGLVCENPADKGWFGASQTLTLNRTSAAPLVVRGWSRAANVTGGADSGYSLYADLVYADGTPLWGQTGNFRCGTHDWEPREFVILPDQPVKSLTLHCLFRGHAGKVWFDDLSIEEVTAGGGAVLFQGVPVVAADVSLRPTPRAQSSRALASAATNGLFLARDVAAGSDFFSFNGGACPDLGLKVQADFTLQSNHLVIAGRVTDTTARDRAVTLVFALPWDAAGWRWGDDIRRRRVIQGRGEFVNQVSVRCGATGTQSLYPLAAVWNEQAGLALALDMARPSVYRVGCHAGLKLLFIAYDFGLVRDTERFPGGADFRFVLFDFEPAWGFRAAWQRYMEVFPDHFVVRAREQGLWMPFTDVSKVEGWQDFGFKFHEGNNNVPWDDEHGVLSFRYTEPMTWWMPMARDRPRTLAEALRARDELAASGNESQRRFAAVTRTAAMHDEAGQPALLFRDEPWCHGAVWSLNPNPWLGTGVANGRSRPDAGASRASTNAATMHWNESIKEKLYGPAARGRLDGEYLDSLEGYVTTDLNFRREHFAASTVPLTFANDSRRPALFKGLAVFEFTRWIADDLHGMGKLTFANGVPYRFTYLCPWLDVLGTETDWLRGGKYAPASDATMSLWRTMSGGKPYLLLMNTDYDRFTPDLVERYFERALFYGLWPGFFSHNAADNPYWQNPKWYNRDRPLFKKYLPILRRVAEAGWQPVTGATCDNPAIFVERFGPGAGGTVFLTLFNDTAQPQSGIVRLSPPLRAGPGDRVQAADLVAGRAAESVPAGFRIHLAPARAAALECRLRPP